MTQKFITIREKNGPKNSQKRETLNSEFIFNSDTLIDYTYC